MQQELYGALYSTFTGENCVGITSTVIKQPSLLCGGLLCEYSLSCLFHRPHLVLPLVFWGLSAGHVIYSCLVTLLVYVLCLMASIPLGDRLMDSHAPCSLLSLNYFWPRSVDCCSGYCLWALALVVIAPQWLHAPLCISSPSLAVCCFFPSAPSGVASDGHSCPVLYLWLHIKHCNRLFLCS